MSYVPDVNMYGMLSDLGSKIASGIKEYKQQQLLSALGQDLMSGDYGSAAQKALGAGDMGTGLKLLELGQQKQQAAALPALLGGLPGQGGGGAQPAQTQDTPQGADLSRAPMPASVGQLPAGMRNNNPGNIKFTSNSAFPGVVGPSKNTDQGDPQAVFATPEAGMAAMYSLAKRKYDGGKTTAASLIAGNMGWTPGNMQAASNVARTMGIGVNDDLRLDDPAQAQKFMRALMLQEHGGASRLYSDGMIAGAVGGQSPSPAMAFAATRKGYNGGAGYQTTAQVAAADSEDDAATAQAQPVQLAQNGRASADDNTEKLDQLRAYQSRLTSTLATVSGEGPRAAINARLTQVQKMIDDIKPDKDKFQLFQNEDGSLLAVNKTDPTQTQIIQTGRKPKSQAEYDTRKTLADDMSLTGTARTAFLANGKLPDQSRVLRPGDQLVDPTGQVTARNEGGANATISDDNADFLAERVLAGDKQALVGLGRGAQGANNLAKVQGLVAQKAQERGLSAKDILANSAEAQGLNAQQRTFGTQTARMSTSSVEAQGAIALGRQASALVPRGNWVPVNKAIQAFQANTSSPELGKFAAANLAIVNTYARAINPNGQPTVADKEHAREMLNTAMGPDQYNAVLDQMQQEIDMAHNSPSIAKRGLENIRKGKAFMDGIGQNDIFSHGGSGSEAPAKAAAPTNGGTTKSGVKWSIE